MYLLTIFRHSDQLIERSENAGLGYDVDADKTVDKLGNAGWNYELHDSFEETSSFKSNKAVYI